MKHKELFVSVNVVLKYGIVKSYIIAFLLDRSIYTSNIDSFARELNSVACFGHAKQSINSNFRNTII